MDLLMEKVNCMEYVNKGKNTLLFLGKEYEVNKIRYKDSKIKIFIRGKNIEMYIPEQMNEIHYKNEISKALNEWYRNICREIINEKLQYYSHKIKVKYNNFRIKDQKTRWGSCSSKNNLNFNWRIVLAPEWVMDYVIIHELCHLVHMDHSSNFWGEVYKYMPNYKDAILWLRNNGHKLFCNV